MKPLAGISVVDLTRYLPGPFASRELMRLGARVTRLLPPGGDPMQELAPAWHARPQRGQGDRSSSTSRPTPEQGRALCAAADVVLEGFRPGVVDRLGIGPADLPETVVYCSFTGFGPDDLTAGHDLNYQGWAGLLHDTAPAMPPVQIADLGSAPPCRRTDHRRAARARAHRPRRAPRVSLTATRARARRAPSRRRAGPAPPHRRARLLPDLRDRGRAAPDCRRARAEVLRAPLRAARPPGARRAPVRPRAGGARRRAGRG